MQSLEVGSDPLHMLWPSPHCRQSLLVVHWYRQLLVAAQPTNNTAARTRRLAMKWCNCLASSCPRINPISEVCVKSREPHDEAVAVASLTAVRAARVDGAAQPSCCCGSAAVRHRRCSSLFPSANQLPGGLQPLLQYLQLPLTHSVALSLSPLSPLSLALCHSGARRMQVG